MTQKESGTELTVSLIEPVLHSSLLILDMTADFKALDIGFEVQRSFANKFLSNKTAAKGLIDKTSADLLDELYKLVKIYVSTTFNKLLKCSVVP